MDLTSKVISPILYHIPSAFARGDVKIEFSPVCEMGTKTNFHIVKGDVLTTLADMCYNKYINIYEVAYGKLPSGDRGIHISPS